MSRTDAQDGDRDLATEAGAGDTAVFERLFNRYQKRVYNLVYRMVGNEQDAADLTQEVFVRVYNSLSTLRSEEAFLPWVRTIALNICRDHFRKSGRTLRADSLDKRMSVEEGEVEREVEDWSSNPERVFAKKDVQETVQRAINSLSQERRAVVVLHHIEGMDVKDIARELRLPVGTVKSRLARARDDLKRKLAHLVS